MRAVESLSTWPYCERLKKKGKRVSDKMEKLAFIRRTRLDQNLLSGPDWIPALTIT